MMISCFTSFLTLFMFKMSEFLFKTVFFLNLKIVYISHTIHKNACFGISLEMS